MPIVNLAEMARLLDVSLPTMRDYITRYPDMPTLQRGGLGKPWEFDAEAVLGFMGERKAVEARAEEERSQQLAQMTLLDGDMRSRSEMGLTAKDYGLEIRNARDLDKLRQERGFLVDKSQMRFQLDAVWRALGNSMNALPSAMGRRHNLPDAVVRDMRRYLHEQQTVIRERLGDLLAPEIRPEEEDELEHVAEAEAPGGSLC